MLMDPAVQNSPAQAPTPPPVPTMPTSPGQSTGAAPQAPAAGTPAATSPAPVTGQQIRDQIRDGIRDGINPGAEAGVLVPPPYQRDSEIPREVIPIMAIVFGSLVVIILGYPIIRLITRLIERASDKSLMKSSEVTHQLKTLQDSVDTLAIEIERISESQRFQDRLLVEQGKEAAKLPLARGGA